MIVFLIEFCHQKINIDLTLFSLLLQLVHIKIIVLLWILWVTLLFLTPLLFSLLLFLLFLLLSLHLSLAQLWAIFLHCWYYNITTSKNIPWSIPILACIDVVDKINNISACRQFSFFSNWHSNISNYLLFSASSTQSIESPLSTPPSHLYAASKTVQFPSSCR